MKTGAIILAAGKGTRMKSALPKVLHKVCGKAMVQIIIDNIAAAEIGKSYIVIGHGAEKVKEVLGEEHSYAVQEPQLGTGHCVMQAIPVIPEDTDGVLVVCGDTPLLKAETLASLKENFVKTGAACTILTAVMPNPTGYGRIIRNEKGNIVAIVEEKDATAEQKKITEVNTGTYFFDYKLLKEALANITNDNAQGEYYLTDTLAYLNANGHVIAGIVSKDADETMGVNDRINLAKADRLLRLRKNEQLMADGVTLIDPYCTYVELDVQVGRDTVIYPNCHLRGKTVIGENCVLDADCQITDSTIGNNCHLIKAIVNESTVGDYADIGPFAYIRPKTFVKDHVKIGHFVEVKKSTVDEGTKIPHLSYIGDAVIGKGVNIGCGTITCNYDGAHKFQTIIGDNVFIGSNSNLVAPVTVEENAYVAAGSTITKKVSKDALAVARARQTEIPGWVPQKAPKKDK